jgi:hypothetical protein
MGLEYYLLDRKTKHVYEIGKGYIEREAFVPGTTKEICSRRCASAGQRTATRHTRRRWRTFSGGSVRRTNGAWNCSMTSDSARCCTTTISSTMCTWPSELAR